MVNKCCMSIYFNLVLILWTFSPEKDILKLPMNAVEVAQVVAYRATDIEVPGAIPSESRAFSLLFITCQSEVHPYSGPSWRCNTTVIFKG